MAQSDSDLIEAAMRAGNIDALAGYAEIVDGFPDGLDPEGQSWLALAVHVAGREVIAWMIAHGGDLNTDSAGFPPLHAALDRRGDDRYEILQMLLDAGADPDQRGGNDWTPLHKAACTDDFRALEMLLRAGADREARTRIDDCATPEEEARYLGHLKSAEMLRAWHE